MKGLFGALVLVVLLGLLATLVAVFTREQPHAPPSEHADAGAAECPPAPPPIIVLPRAKAARLAESTALESGARTEPAFEDDLMSGMRFLWVRPGSLYAEVGLCSGDVVTHVAGDAMNSPEAVLDAYEKVKSLEEITVSVVRQGTRRDFKVQVR